MHKSTGGNQFWDQQKDYVINMYANQHIPIAQIAKHYDCHPTTIQNHLHRWDVPISKHRHNAIYDVDTNFFKNINNESSAYFFGLLLSDGHVSKQNTIMLTMKDLDIIEKYKSAIRTNHPITRDRYGNHTLNITSKDMSEDLRALGIHNRKSYHIDINKIVNNVPDHLLHHFIRGMFDGDGSIRIYHYDYCKNPQYHFGYTGLKNVVDYVYEYLGLHTKIVQESDITYTCVTTCKATIIDIYNKLYKDATIYIQRKHDTFLQIIQ